MALLFNRAHLLTVLLLVLGCSSDSGDHDFDGDGWEDDVDCEPDDPDSYPNATEDCGDGVDNDCDGFTDGEDGDCSGDDDSTGDDDTGDDDTGDDDSAGDDDTEDDDTSDDDTTSGEDSDGDGYTVGDGDCDDHDPTVNPGAFDECDALDNDCDGRTNDDVTATDMYETWTSAPHDLGSLTGSYDTYFVYAQHEGDEDRYLFFVEDVADVEADEFYIEIYAEFIPATVDLSLTLYLDDGVQGQNVLLDTADDEPDGGNEAIIYDGTNFMDESGTYELIVNAESGYDCDTPYPILIGASYYP